MRAVDEAVNGRVVTETVPEAPATSRRRVPEIGVYGSYLALSLFVMIQLWIDPDGRVLSSNDDDHGVFMFMLAHGERVIFHGANPFFSDRLNVPDGVNMMANTSILALSLPVAPVTHFLGAGVSVALLLTMGLFGTASAWYRVLSRHLVQNRLAAWIGGLWCGFSPAMIAHANGHINFVCQFVVPFIVWQVIRLREPGRVLRGGLVLGLLVVLQVFINEETLLFTALTLGVFVVAYAAMAPRRAIEAGRRFAAGLGVAVLVASALLAYPLWDQFFAPGSYHGQPFPPDKYVTDLLSVGAYARQSLAGNGAVARQLSVSATEDNTFFGVPLLIMLVVAMVLLWRSVAARAAAIAGLVLLVVSMGPQLRAGGHDTAIPLPFGLVSRVPVIDLVSVTRFAIVTACVVGVLLALAADRIAGYPRPGYPRPAYPRPGYPRPGYPRPAYPRRRRVLFWAGLIVAFVPVFPKPLPIVVADPLPPFIADGTWRAYVPVDRSLVTVPLPEVTSGRTGMRWAALSRLEFRIPRGYFMGPAQPPFDDTGSWNAPPRFGSALLVGVGETGVRPVLTDADRQAFTADLTYWRAAVVVLVPNARNVDQLRATLVDLLGRPPRLVGGVQLWQIPPSG